MTIESRLDTLTDTVANLVVEMRNGFARLIADTSSLRADVPELKLDVHELKSVTHELNRRVGNLEVGMEDVKELLGDTAQAVDANSVTLIDHGKRIRTFELRIA